MRTRITFLPLLATTLLAASASRATGQSMMNTEQTLSDQAQGTTIAFGGLVFLTGNLGADSEIAHD